MYMGCSSVDACAISTTNHLALVLIFDFTLLGIVSAVRSSYTLFALWLFCYSVVQDYFSKQGFYLLIYVMRFSYHVQKYHFRTDTKDTYLVLEQKASHYLLHLIP